MRPDDDSLPTPIWCCGGLRKRARPGTEQVLARLEQLRRQGPSAGAFQLRAPFAPPDAPVPGAALPPLLSGAAD